LTLYLLLLLGLYFSLITTLATLYPNSKWILFFPDICEDGSCKKIFLAKNARLLFNIQNSLLGCVYYIILFVGSISTINDVLVYITIIPFLMSIYLTYRLFFVHQIFCKICISSHLVNVGLFSYFLAKGNL
jgi:uncharacterized membrane protein